MRFRLVIDGPRWTANRTETLTGNARHRNLGRNYTACQIRVPLNGITTSGNVGSVVMTRIFPSRLPRRSASALSRTSIWKLLLGPAGDCVTSTALESQIMAVILNASPRRLRKKVGVQDVVTSLHAASSTRMLTR